MYLVLREMSASGECLPGMAYAPSGAQKSASAPSRAAFSVKAAGHLCGRGGGGVVLGVEGAVEPVITFHQASTVFKIVEL